MKIATKTLFVFFFMTCQLHRLTAEIESYPHQRTIFYTTRDEDGRLRKSAVPHVSWPVAPCPICIESLSSLKKRTINLRILARQTRGIRAQSLHITICLASLHGRSLILVRTGKIYALFVGSRSAGRQSPPRSRCMSASAILDSNYRSACQAASLFSRRCARLINRVFLINGTTRDQHSQTDVAMCPNKTELADWLAGWLTGWLVETSQAEPSQYESLIVTV